MGSAANRTTQLIVVALLLLTAGGVSACSTKKPSPPSQAADAGLPSDKLAADEIVEGPEKAWGLPLPRQSTVLMRFPESVIVNSQLTMEQLSNFVRARVTAGTGKIVPGTTMTAFEDVTAIADPTHRMTIEIRRGTTFGGPRSEMIVRDVTASHADPKIDAAEGWKRAGMTPDGKLLDPKHMQ